MVTVYEFASSESSEKEEVRDRIVKMRKKKGLTQSQLADVIGFGRTTYAYHEKRGIFPSDMLVKLAEALDVTVDYILNSKVAFAPIESEPTILETPGIAASLVVDVEEFETTKKEQAFLKKLRDLPNSDRETVYGFIDMLYKKNQEKDG